MEKTEYEKMRSEEMYTYFDPEIEASLLHADKSCMRFNQTGMYSPDYRSALENMIPGIPKTVMIAPPFWCDHGSGIHLGEEVIINRNATILDGGNVTIGNFTKIGPNCSFYTSTHPMDYMERRKPQETCRPITIGEDCWLGGNVTVLGGVTIGNRCVIGAGSVVTKDIPDDCFAAGNPARVIRVLKR